MPSGRPIEIEGRADARKKGKAAYDLAYVTEANTNAREIGPLPVVGNPGRRGECSTDLGKFLKTYFPMQFSLAFSADHLIVIGYLETTIVTGGLYALAMPRGSGKTTICEGACIWAVLNGYRKFVVLVSSESGAAEMLLESVKHELGNNELLIEDFPEVCYPIARIEGISARARAQTLNGARTEIDWKRKIAVMPTVAGSIASGAIILPKGLTGSIRGTKLKTADGRQLRPDLVLADDPQTDESAASESQNAQRERLLSGAILGLAGPGKKIAAVMPCTVIRKGDMADRILDRQTHPEWNGTKMRLVQRMPDRMDLWGKYAEARAAGLRAEDKGVAANEYYTTHRADMDAGAVVVWQDRVEPGEVSALQNAMNIYCRDGDVFWSEYQNEPRDPNAMQDELTAEQIARKVNGLKRGTVPLSTTHITAMIDVQGKILYYAVVAWDDKFTGSVIDYGSYPDQGRATYFAASPPQPLDKVTKAGSVEACILAGLMALNESVISREWTREGGTCSKIDLCLVDANWGLSTDTVYDFARRVVSAKVLPSHGKYIGASIAPMDAWRKMPGDRTGPNWRIPKKDGKRAVQHVMYDTNFWKSLVHARLGLPIGNRGALSLYQAEPAAHKMFADHLTAEVGITSTGAGRSVVEWRLKQSRPDNHLLDCVVACAAAASVLGISHIEVLPKSDKAIKKRFSEIQKARRHAV